MTEERDVGDVAGDLAAELAEPRSRLLEAAGRFGELAFGFGDGALLLLEDLAALGRRLPFGGEGLGPAAEQPCRCR